ncbi:unnamed protein product [Linum trigynum]|uniref:Uncharacterized protein n=1 Tax=Linum trigynum TaxID=586398 RepID=A0AAV2DDD0_9ROSI
MMISPNKGRRFPSAKAKAVRSKREESLPGRKSIPPTDSSGEEVETKGAADDSRNCRRQKMTRLSKVGNIFPF